MNWFHGQIQIRIKIEHGQNDEWIKGENTLLEKNGATELMVG